MKAKRPDRPPRPPREDWRVSRARYLIEIGRLDQLKAENLEHFVRVKGANS